MKLVADANILFAALIKDGRTRQLWFNSTIQLYAPEYLLAELAKYKKDLLKKSGKNEKSLDEVLKELLSIIEFSRDEELKPYLPAAASLSKDDKDWLYLACALKENAFIWSNDLEFQKQTRVKTITTEELPKELKEE